MTTFQKIIKAIEKFGYPYAPDYYKGTSDHYFTYNYVIERVKVCADNQAQEIVDSIQLHFFLPKSENYLKLKNQIRDALMDQGFTFPDITVLIKEKTRHIVFECDVEQEE